MDEDIEKHINKISWGGQFASVKRSDGSTTLIILRLPTLKDKNFIEFIYQFCLTEALDAGVLSRFELINKLKATELWDQKDEDIIKEMDAQLKEMKSNKPRTSREKRMLALRISGIQELLADKLSYKNCFFRICAENYAEQLRNDATVFCSVYDKDDNRFWNSWEDYQAEVDNILIENIAVELNKFQVPDNKTVRLIARSPTWRFRWNGAKNTSNLFGRPIMELDLNQQNLLYWSQVYDSVYEAYERPADNIIEDDEKLDRWFEEQNKKEKVKQVDSTGKIGGFKLSDRVSQHGEVFVVTNPQYTHDTKYLKHSPDIPTNEDIENLNTDAARKFKNKEVEIIRNAGGSIKEQNLRSRERKISRKMISSSDAVIGKRNNMSGQAKGKAKILPGGTI